MIRLRRVPPRGILRRKLYEIELPPQSVSGASTREVTRTPVTRIEQTLGVGDAWTLVHAADDAWDGESGDWVTLRADD